MWFHSFRRLMIHLYYWKPNSMRMNIENSCFLSNWLTVLSVPWVVTVWEKPERENLQYSIPKGGLPTSYSPLPQYITLTFLIWFIFHWASSPLSYFSIVLCALKTWIASSAFLVLLCRTVLQWLTTAGRIVFSSCRCFSSLLV